MPMPPPQKPSTPVVRRKRTSRPIAVLVTFGWLGVLLLLALNRQNIYDWWKLHNYTPPATVAQIATQDTMTSYARKVFYVNQPAIEDKTSFTQCPAGDEKTIVLGCYRGGQNGIFVLGVSDPRLNGVEQVTAAHEMLHAAYDRLSAKDRAAVDAMLQDYYQHDLADARIKATIEDYRQSEPTALVNEMHSIFGTEIASLPAPLEHYYQRYFTNRQAVTGFAGQYQAEFTSRADAVKADDARLATMKTEITSQQADLKTKRAALDAESNHLQQARSSGDIAAYNAAVPGYNASVNSYNAGVDSLQALVAQYNQLVSERNAIALETQQLTNEINSQATTINQ